MPVNVFHNLPGISIVCQRKYGDSMVLLQSCVYTVNDGICIFNHLYVPSRQLSLLARWCWLLRVLELGRAGKHQLHCCHVSICPCNPYHD